jgi:hypothetical protein
VNLNQREINEEHMALGRSTCDAMRLLGQDLKITCISTRLITIALSNRF